jgi:hypothetical protein
MSGADWGAWWDSFDADYFTRGWSGFWDGGGGTIEPDYLVPYGGPTTAPLPGYCPPGQYHPIDDPYACIPFPAPTSPARSWTSDNGEAFNRRDTAKTITRGRMSMLRLSTIRRQRNVNCPRAPWSTV